MLPAPDRLAVRWPANRSCWVTDDGSSLSPKLAATLQSWGWSVTLLRFPASLVPVSPERVEPEGLSVVTFDGLEPEAFERQIEALSQRQDPVGAWIYVHPSMPSMTDAPGALDDDRTPALLRSVFLAAAHLGPALTEAATEGRSLFATVTRMDGALGMGGSEDFDPRCGGFSGLVKTLQQEWPGVFCRALDLDPAYDADRAAAVVLSELQDPNRRLVDVGWRGERRVTLGALLEED